MIHFSMNCNYEKFLMYQFQIRNSILQILFSIYTVHFSKRTDIISLISFQSETYFDINLRKMNQ